MCCLQGTTARVKIINCVTGEDETSKTTGGVLPPTTDPDAAPYVIRGTGANRWNATLRLSGGTPTQANPIPRAGCWRFQIALVSGLEWLTQPQVELQLGHQSPAETMRHNTAGMHCG